MVLHQQFIDDRTWLLLLFVIELVLGFSPTEYEVHENDKLSVTVEVFIQGILEDYQLMIFMSTHNGTATGQIFQTVCIVTVVAQQNK